MLAEWAQALRCVTLGLSTSCVCPLPVFVHCLRLSTSCVCPLPSRTRPDGSRRSARIRHAAFNVSGMGASPPVCHIGSVHFLRLSTSCVCPLPAFVHCLRLSTSCVCPLPSRTRPDGSRRSARIRHAVFCGSGKGASPPVCSHWVRPLPASVHFLCLSTSVAPKTGRLAPYR